MGEVKQLSDLSNISEEVLNTLECPVCISYMGPPIMLCVNGHNICSKCRYKVTQCPTCRDDFAEIRNLFAENVAEKYMVPCRYYSDGCRTKVYPQQRQHHENCCSYSPMECQIGIGIDNLKKCGWKGNREQLLAHVRDGTCPRSVQFVNHPYVKAYSRRDGVPRNCLLPCLSWRSHPLTAPWYVGVDFKQSYRSQCLVRAFEELFWIHVYNNAKEQKHYEVMTYVGSEEEAMKFNYEHTLHSLDGKQSITFVNTMHSQNEDVDKLFALGDCLLLDFSTFKKYFNEEKRNLPGYTLTIKGAVKIS